MVEGILYFIAIFVMGFGTGIFFRDTQADRVEHKRRMLDPER